MISKLLSCLTLFVTVQSLVSSASAARLECSGLFKDPAAVQELSLNLPQKYQYRPAPTGVRDFSEIKELKIMSFNVENFFWKPTQAQIQARLAEQQQYIRQQKVPSWYLWGRPLVWQAQKNQSSGMGKNDDIKPEFEIERIRQITDDEYPDLMIATEIESQQALEHLASKGLKDKYKSYLIEGNDSRGIDIGFLVKVDLPFFIEQQTHKDMLWPLDGRQVRIFSRDVPALLLSKSKGEKPFLIVLGNHAKSKRDGDGDPLSNKLRTAQYEAMAKIITEYQKQFPNTPIVLGGDFNTQVNTAREVQPILPLVKSGFL
ncbi:MAG: endonuclease/exonuclease/phosphatase family protein, partial [Pseudobdellovibrionaceae bacterium]